jgi:hypothetical protein
MNDEIKAETDKLNVVQNPKMKMHDKRMRSRHDVFHPYSSKQISDIFNVKKRIKSSECKLIK